MTITMQTSYSLYESRLLVHMKNHVLGVSMAFFLTLQCNGKAFRMCRTDCLLVCDSTMQIY